jgi:hypothetical protein
LIITNSSIVENSAEQHGGGLIIDRDRTAMITNSTIAHNSALGFCGGGIIVQGMATITNSTITNNSAVCGGGIRVEFGTTMITNSTIANNSVMRSGVSFGNGGGLFIAGDGTATITNSTIAHNSASDSGGGLRNSSNTTVRLQNTILAEITGSGAPDDCLVASGTATSLGHNLIGSLSRCPITLLSTDLTGEPGLGPFMSDDIPGDGHFPLLSTSRAINAGNDAVCPPTDQLGQPRVGRCDIGAIEFQSIVVLIDIKPGSADNPIDLRRKDVIPVVILTTDTFDATDIDPSTVEFGPDGATEAHGRGHIEDANKDRRLDLVLHFNTQDTGIQCGDTSASLTEQTFDEQAIEGTNAIITVGCK